MAVFAAAPACAGEHVPPPPAPGHADLLPLNFDLAQRDPYAILAYAEEDAAGDSDKEEEGALDEPELPLRPWDDEGGLKREWSIQPIEEGPALEVAALGGGRKKSGKLAHVRVSWAF